MSTDTGSARPRTALVRHVLGVLVLGAPIWLAAGAMPAWADDGGVEYLDFPLEDLLTPGSPLLRPGMHVHDCGEALDVYVTERVPLHGGITLASRRATLHAYRTIAKFAYGSGGSREQDVVYAESGAGAEVVGTRVRNRVTATGVVSGLRPAARLRDPDGESLLMVFVLPLSGAQPTADCPPKESTPPPKSPSAEIRSGAEQQ